MGVRRVQRQPAVDPRLVTFDVNDVPGLHPPARDDPADLRPRFLTWCVMRKTAGLPAHPDGRSFADLCRLSTTELAAAAASASTERNTR